MLGWWLAQTLSSGASGSQQGLPLVSLPPLPAALCPLSDCPQASRGDLMKGWCSRGPHECPLAARKPLVAMWVTELYCPCPVLKVSDPIPYPLRKTVTRGGSDQRSHKNPLW